MPLYFIFLKWDVVYTLLSNLIFFLLMVILLGHVNNYTIFSDVKALEC